MIEIQELTRHFGPVRALDGVSFEIRQGEVLGLLGPNGAGKTTAMRILTGYLRPTSGDVRVKGLSIRDRLLPIKRMIGYLPESAPLYPDMLVYDYLRCIAELRGLPRDRREGRLHQLSALCGLAEVMHRPIRELSKGFKQRAGLAHAMMADPEVLVLDEPTSGLDPNQIVEIRDIIRRIGREKTVILSTHILSEVEATCDRVVIISKGRIVASGRTAELRQMSGDAYAVVIALQGAGTDGLADELARVPGVAEVEALDAGENASGWRVLCRTAEDLRPALFEKIRESGRVLLEFRREVKSLESIFRELTRED